MPKISVLMGVYNCTNTLPYAIDSILSQTYPDWELIACDDGSTDASYAVLKKYQDALGDKILVLKNEENMGLNFTLNRCLENASGEYIARMDGDDYSYPQRFEVELDALNGNREIAFVSTDMEFFDDLGVWGRTNAKRFPEKKDFVKGSPFCHAPCMIRTSAMKAVGGYTVSKRFLRVEDYHLWVKLYEAGYRGQNLSQLLYKMRDDRNAQKRKKFVYRINESYVKALAIKHLGLSKLNYIFCLRPLLIGMLPSAVYKVLHRFRHHN